MDRGYVKMYRKTKDWEWYKDFKTNIYFHHCVYNAVYRTQKWRGRTIEIGSFVTTVSRMTEETGLTAKEQELCVSKLLSTGEIKIKTTTKGTIITVCNFATYQHTEDEKGKQRENEGETKGKPRENPILYTKKDKKDKNEKNTTKGGKSYNGYSDEELEKDRLALESSSDVEKRQWNAFVEHMKKYPVINSFEKPITFRQFISLKQDFVEPNGSLMRLIDPVLADMELYYDSDSAKKRRVLHLCLRQFLRNRNVKQVVPTIEPIRRVK